MAKELVYKATFTRNRTLLVSKNKYGKLSYEFFHSLTRDNMHISYLNLNLPLPDDDSELWDGENPKMYQPQEVLDRVLLSNASYRKNTDTLIVDPEEFTIFTSKRM